MQTVRLRDKGPYSHLADAGSFCNEPFFHEKKRERVQCVKSKKGPLLATDTFSSAGIHIILRRNGGQFRFSLKAFVISFKNQELISYCDEASIVMEVFKPTSQLTNSIVYILSFIFEGNVPSPLHC
jgi:hypothetical protein